jgi:hypothetical protein
MELPPRGEMAQSGKYLSFQGISKALLAVFRVAGNDIESNFPHQTSRA